jgi:hypothetical protein
VRLKKTMVEHLADMMQREWNLMNSDANNVNNSSTTRRASQSHIPSWPTSDHNSHTHGNHSHHQHVHQHQQSIPSTPVITTTDYSDPSSLSAMRVPQTLFHRHSLDTGYDTDGGIGTPTTKHHHKSSNGYAHLVSPRLPSKRSLPHQSKQLPVVSFHHHPSQPAHLTVNPYSSNVQNHDDKDEEPLHGGDTHRHHIRLNRAVHHPSSTTENHGAHVTHVPKIPRHEKILATTSSGRSFRLIFMRHSERVNQALGPDWFIKAFRTGSYQPYDQNLPMSLPKRRSDQAYQFDAPLTS